MSESLGTAVLDLTADGSKLDKGLQDAESNALATMDRVGAKMLGVGTKMTLGVTGPLALVGNKAADMASNLNESINAVNVVFGEGADKIHAFGEVAAETAGLSTRAFNELVTPVGAALQNVGYGADEAADASINLAKRAADMASVFNVDVSEALGAIQAGLRGEADPLERFGVGLNAAAVEAEAMRLGLVETTVDLAAVERAQLAVEKSTAKHAAAIKKHGADSLEARDAASQLATAESKLEASMAGSNVELDDQAKMQARLSLLMRQTDRVAGDFVNTSDGVANAQRVTAAEVENAAAAFGQKLLPIKGQLISMLGRVVDWFNQLSPSAQNVILVVAGLVAAIGPLLLIIGSGIAAVTSIVGVLGTMATALGLVTAAGAPMIGTLLLIIGAVVAVIAIGILVWKNWDKIVAALAAAWTWVKAQAVAIWGAIVGFFKTKLAETKAEFTAAWNAIKAALAAVWNGIKAAATATWNGIKAGFAAVLNGIKAVFTTIWGAIVAVVVGLWNRLKASATIVFNGIKAVITGVLNGIRTIFQTVFGTLVAIGQTIGAAIRGVVSDFMAAVKGIFTGDLTAVVTLFTNLPKRIVGALGNVGRLLYDAGRKIVQGLIDGIKAMVGKVGDAIGSVTRKISRYLPGSPVKEGPLRVINHGRAGEKITRMIADGIANADVSSQAGAMASKLLPSVPGGAAAAMPSVLEVRDVDGALVGRMRVEAHREIGDVFSAGTHRARLG